MKLSFSQVNLLITRFHQSTRTRIERLNHWQRGRARGHLPGDCQLLPRRHLPRRPNPQHYPLCKGTLKIFMQFFGVSFVFVYPCYFSDCVTVTVIYRLYLKVYSNCHLKAEQGRAFM